MITCYGDAETKHQALEYGAEALLTKPIDFCDIAGRPNRMTRTGSGWISSADVVLPSGKLTFYELLQCMGQDLAHCNGNPYPLECRRSGQVRTRCGRVGEDVATLTPHRSGCADFPLPVPHGRASLTAV